MSAKYTAQQIVDGFLYAELEFSELPTEADKLNVIGDLLDQINDRYWELNDDFWTRVGKKAKPVDIMKLYEMVPDAEKLVAEGLKAKAEEDAESSSEEEVKKGGKRDSGKKTGGKKDGDKPSGGKKTGDKKPEGKTDRRR